MSTPALPKFNAVRSPGVHCTVALHTYTIYICAAYANRVCPPGELYPCMQTVRCPMLRPPQLERPRIRDIEPHRAVEYIAYVGRRSINP